MTNNNFFSWPYHAILSSRLHSAILLLTRGIWPKLCCGLLSQRGSLHDCKTFLTPADSDPHMTICLYHFVTPTFPINHLTASAYFHRCILFRESLIDSLVKGQHTIQDELFLIVNLTWLRYIYIYIYMDTFTVF